MSRSTRAPLERLTSASTSPLMKWTTLSASMLLYGSPHREIGMCSMNLSPAQRRPSDARLKFDGATLPSRNATLIHFDEPPHWYHFVADRFGVIESSVPPTPIAPATDEPSAMFSSTSSSPGPPRSACTSARLMPASILS